MKRVFVFVLCLLLLYTTALAEKYEGIDPFYLEREFDHWNLSETYRGIENGLEAVLYTDAKGEKQAGLAYYGDAVCMAGFIDVTYDSKYLEQMFQATLAGEPAWLQVIASLTYEAHMPNMQDGGFYSDTLDDIYFRLYREGDSWYVVVEKDADTIDALLVPSEASTPQPTVPPTPTPTPTPRPTNTPKPTSTPVSDLSAMSAEKAVQGLAEHAQNATIQLDYVMEIEGLVNVGAIITEMVWDEEMAVERLCEYVLDISKYAFANQDVDSLVFYFDTKLNYNDGTSSLARVAQVNISRKTAERLDYKQAALCVYRSTREALNLFDDTYIHPALSSGIK